MNIIEYLYYYFCKEKEVYFFLPVENLKVCSTESN